MNVLVLGSGVDSTYQFLFKLETLNLKYKYTSPLCVLLLTPTTIASSWYILSSFKRETNKEGWSL